MYTYFVYTQESVSKYGNNTISSLACEGKIVFQKYNCISCHQLYGLGGYLGPDLTNVISEKGAHDVTFAGKRISNQNCSSRVH